MATGHSAVDGLPLKEFELFAAAEIVAGGAVVVASPSGVWICRDGESRSVGLALTSRHTSEPSVVRQLLAGSLMAACPRPSGPAPPEAEPSLNGYVFDLCLTYQTTTATSATLRTARDRFLTIGDGCAADFAERKAAEERGHDRLALRDLEALGLPAGILVLKIVPTLGQALVDSFKALSLKGKPYGVFGYAYVLERMAMMRDHREIEAIQALAPNGADITRCRRVHSAFGVDTDHVADLVQFVADLPVADRLTVCRAVHQTAALMAEARDDRIQKEALGALVASWGWVPFVGVSEDPSVLHRGVMGG